MVDQVKVIEIGADALEVALTDDPYLAAYPPKLMHAVVAALGRHGFIIEDRYEEEAGPIPHSPEDWLGSTVAPDWDPDSEAEEDTSVKTDETTDRHLYLGWARAAQAQAEGDDA